MSSKSGPFFANEVVDPAIERLGKGSLWARADALVGLAGAVATGDFAVG